MKKIPKLNFYAILSFSILGFLFFHLARQMLQFRADGLYVGHINLYGDLVFHLGFINKFLETGQILPQSPVFAGTKPNYPIFVDFVTAQLTRFTGVDFALFIITFLVGLAALFLARNFILNFIKNEKVVFITFLIFFLNGGFGFYYFFQDFLNNQKPFLDFLFALPRQYTDIKDIGYWWINSYLAYFLPQRGFLFAFPITLVTLVLLYRGYKKHATSYFFFAAILAGILPLVQAHSLFVIFIVSAFFSIATIIRSKFDKEVILNWFIFALVTSTCALPFFKAISAETNPLKFIRFDPGWTNDENIFWFWLKNLGLFGPLLLISLVWLFKKSRHLFFLYIPFGVIFILSNIFIFQPWEFDNSKLLIYWFFVSAVIVSYFLYDELLSANIFKKIIAIVLLFIMVFAGGLDLFRTFTPITSYQIFSSKDVEIAQAVKNLTPKNSVFTTSFNHNHPIPALSGRSTLLGFRGWAWSHGLDYRQREVDIGKIYLGGEAAEELIKKYRVSYVTIGPLERSTFSINESYFAKFSLINLSSGWVLYDVGNLWSDGNR